MIVGGSMLEAAAGRSVGGAGPSAAPTSPGFYVYGVRGPITDALVGFTWTNGDSTAGTQILRDGAVFTTRSPGVASFETGLSLIDVKAHTWTGRHVKNGQVSSSITFIT